MLLWILLAPFIGGLLCWQVERLSVQLPRWIALFSMLLTLSLSVILWLEGDFSLSQQGGPTWSAECHFP